MMVLYMHPTANHLASRGIELVAHHVLRDKQVSKVYPHTKVVVLNKTRFRLAFQTDLKREKDEIVPKRCTYHYPSRLS
jgi:hypothetical protein